MLVGTLTGKIVTYRLTAWGFLTHPIDIDKKIKQDVPKSTRSVLKDMNIG